MEQLLRTKLYIPHTRPNLVARPRLIERLIDGLHRKLTLISAPAGFGKTTLLSEWIPKSPRCVCWLSLDDGDSEPTRFWTYFIASLQGLRADLGNDALALLQSRPAPPIPSIMMALINEISAFQDDFAIVLDDYHITDAKPEDEPYSVDATITYLLEHLPPQMHIVIATREDPNIPLARLRAQGQLTELRADDLRFTPGEAATFLNQVMGLGLSTREVASLETRTEGWIAGLQLAALSMQGREDLHGFIKAFAGDHRYIVDYLVEEVLQRQTERVRSFLLQTSILDRISGPLCDAVTGQEGSGTLVETLERGNLFIRPLDDRREWFRYHHLFADVLRVHLREEQSDQLPILHKRAAEWYKQNNLLPEAISHALAAEDFDLAADLIELVWPAMDRGRQSTKWLGWAKALPDNLFQNRPVLSAGHAWALLDRGNLEAGEARLREAEKWLEVISDRGEQSETSPGKMVVVDKEEFQSLPASIAAAHAYHALAVGDVPGTVKYAQRALALIPADDYFRRGTPDSLLALASWASGDLEAANQSLSEAMTSFQMTGNTLFAITGTYVLAEIRITLGRLREAFNIYQQSLQLAADHGKSAQWGTADLYTGLSELLREQGDLEAAAEHLLRSKELGEKAALPRWYFRWCLTKSRLMVSLGELESALELLDEAERNFVRGPVPDVRPIAAFKARVLAVKGKLTEAWNLMRERGLSVDDDTSYLHEFEHITLARILIDHYRIDCADHSILDAISLLERLQKAAEKGGRTGSMIEILILQALAHEAQGKLSAALESVERALRLAEPEGYFRIFVDEGIPMYHLLTNAAAHGIMPGYTNKLLAAFKAQEPYRENERSLSPDQRSQPLIEPLSEREIEVLKLIAQGLSNREIGDRLFLALPTVKGYIRTIFKKLQVRRRTEAVAQARELGLL